MQAIAGRCTTTRMSHILPMTFDKEMKESLVTCKCVKEYSVLEMLRIAHLRTSRLIQGAVPGMALQLVYQSLH